MADIQKTVQVLFGTDYDGSGVDSALGGFNKFDAAVQGIADPVASFTENLLKVEAAVAAAGVAMAGVAINEAGQFSDAVDEIGTLFVANSEQISGFKNDILDYSRASTQSISDINSAVYTAISAGTDWTQSLDLLKQSEELAVAGVADLESTTRLLASSLNAYGADAGAASGKTDEFGNSINNAQAYSDALFTAVKLGQTTIPELAASLAQVTGVASAADVPFETLTAAIAALTATGAPTSQAITGIKAALSNIIKPTKDAEDAAKSLGIEFNATALSTKGLDGLMQELGEKTGGNTELMAKFFGSVEGLNAALILSTDTSGKFAAALDEMKQNAGATEAAFKAMESSIKLVNQNLVNNIKATLVDAGTPLLEEYAGAVGALGEVFKALGSSVEAPEFQPVYDALESFINNFTDTLDGIANALPEAMEQVDFSGLIDSFGGLGDAFSDAFDAIFGPDLDLSKPEDLAKALQQGVNILQVFVDLTKGIINEFQPVFDAIGKAAEEISKVDGVAAESTGNLLGAITLIGNFGTVLGGILVAIKESGADIENVFNVIAGSVKVFVNIVQLSFDAFYKIVADTIARVADAFAAVTWGDLSDGYKQVADDMRAKSAQLSSDFDRNLGELGDAWDQTMDGLSGGADKASSSIDKIGDSSGKAAPKVKDAADATQDLSSAIDTDAIDGLNEAMADMGIQFDETGKIIKETSDDIAGSEQQWRDLTDQQKAMAEALGLATPKLSEFQSEMEKLPQSVRNSLDATDDFAQKLEILEAAEKGMLLEFKDGQKVFTDFNKGLKEVKDNTKDTTEETDKAKEAMAKLSLELEKIASNERIKNLELAVELNVAQIEADAKKYAAALESVAEVAGAISDSIGVLSEAFNDADQNGSRSAKRFIEDIIERQEERLDKELELQAELIQKQIDLMDAQAQAIANNEAFISVEANGLEPELEAFMFKILERIQIKVASAQDLFLANAGF